MGIVSTGCHGNGQYRLSWEWSVQVVMGMVSTGCHGNSQYRLSWGWFLPHRYNSLDQLMCVICNVHVKSDILWPTHLQSKKHKEVMM